jgi:hypothetical protein
MKTLHAFRVVYEDDEKKPATVDYFVGKTVMQAFTNVMNLTPSGVKREIVGIERVLANVITPDA